MIFNTGEIFLGPGSPEQAAGAAALIYDADPVLWDCLFDNDLEGARHYFEEEWRWEESIYGCAMTTVAALHGELVGIEQGLDVEIQRKFGPGTGLRGAARLDPQTARTLEKYSAYLRYLIPSVPKDVYYLQFLSVKPELRGKGLGKLLLSNAFDHARKKGYRACQLDVSGDTPAVDFYGHMGMETISESRVIPLEKHGLHSHFRLEKVL